MKNIIKFLLVFAAMLIGTVACQDESLITKNVPKWDTAINTFASKQTGSAADFVNGNAAVDIDLNWRWISADGNNTVTKVEYFILFDEKYIDKEGNDKTVRHGGTAGKLFKTLEGAAIGASRADVGFSVTQADIYNVYKSAKYNYCGTEVSVFSNTLKPSRTPANPFLAGDSFTLKWTVYTADGRIFDSWSPSVCNEVPGSNCQFGWGVVCTSNLAGTFNYSTTVSAVGPGGVPQATPLTGTITFTSVSTGSYTNPDVSYGVYGAVYGDSPAKGTKFSDACGFISNKGVDQYGDNYSLTVVSVTPTQLTFNWSNTYGDKATTTLTRTDSKTWPSNLTSSASGSCN